MDEKAREALAKYEKETDAISRAIDKIHEKIETIESRYQISLSEHVEESDKAIASNDIARLLDQTEKTSEAIRKRLRRIAEENKTFAAEHPNKTGELRVRINTHTGITRRFMDAMQLFEESQEKHRDNVKSAMERHLRMMNPQANEDDIQEALRSGAIDDIVDESPILADLPLEQQTRLRRGLADLKNRNNDIKKLEESIIQLHQLFVDMQILVEAQGELLNDIEYNIGETKGKTEAGLQELVQARAHQKSAHRKQICIALLVIILISAILIPVLVKFIPKWFPSTQETIDNLPIIGSGGSGNSTSAEESSSSAPPPESPTRSFGEDNASSLRKLNVISVEEEAYGLPPRRPQGVSLSHMSENIRQPSDAAELSAVVVYEIFGEAERSHGSSGNSGIRFQTRKTTDVLSVGRSTESTLRKTSKNSRHHSLLGDAVDSIVDMFRWKTDQTASLDMSLRKSLRVDDEHSPHAVKATDLCAALSSR